MKRKRLKILTLSFALIYTSSFAQTSVHDWESLAKKIIHVSAEVKRGDVVVISGGKHTIPFMEQLSIETEMKGGISVRLLETDRVARSYVADIPMVYLDQDLSFFGRWFDDIDLFIGLPDLEDPESVMADVPEERMAKINESSEVVQDMLNRSSMKTFFVEYPTQAEAASLGLDFETYETMHWAAVNADYEAISRQGHAIRRMLQDGRRVRVTTPHGTDFTFDVGDRLIVVNDGIIKTEQGQGALAVTRHAALPAGRLVFAPVEASASGKVVVPRHLYNYQPMTGISFTFKNGIVTHFQAKEGGYLFQQALAPYKGQKDRFGVFQIGLNPAVQVIEDGADYRPSNAAGIVYIGIGFNRMLGGTNETQGGFSFPIVNATVEIDGKVVVKDGTLRIEED